MYYISHSIPSLYGILDFFQFTRFYSHQIGLSWVDPKEGFHLCLSSSQAFVLPRIPNRTRTYESVSHPLVMRTFHHHLGVNLGVGHSSHPRVALGWAYGGLG